MSFDVLGRTKNKRYEAYVVSQLFIYLTTFTLKLSLNSLLDYQIRKLLLTDLYFPWYSY